MWKHIRETSSHANCQGTLGHSRLRSLSHCGLILARPKKWNCVQVDLHFLKKCSQGMNRQTFPQSPRKRGNSHHQFPPLTVGTGTVHCAPLTVGTGTVYCAPLTGGPGTVY